MKKHHLSIILFVFILSGCGWGYDQYLKQADQAYETDDKETAKKLYLKASQEGSPEAHFAIAYKYHVTPEESIYHFSEAAKRGHGKALGYALEGLLFRANSLKTADPQGALDLYYKAKKVNPDLELYDEENKLKVMKMCVEPGEFDAEAFCKKYDVIPENHKTMYHVWKIAEEASRGGRFGDPDPKLVLHLVSRGGWAPAELEYAVEEAYNNWKDGVVKEFKICDYITSGGGMGFCASRADEEDKKEREKKLKELGKKLDDNSQKLLDLAYQSAVEFVEIKASKEEGHGGSGITAWIIGSEMEQKNEYLQLIEKIQNGYNPDPKSTFLEADRQLNESYQGVLKELISKHGNDYYLPSPDDLRAVQRLWIPYRDATVKLFMQINPAVSEDIWNSWLTEIREKQLRKILQLYL